MNSRLVFDPSFLIYDLTIPFEKEEIDNFSYNVDLYHKAHPTFRLPLLLISLHALRQCPQIFGWPWNYIHFIFSHPLELFKTFNLMTPLKYFRLKLENRGSEEGKTNIGLKKVSHFKFNEGTDASKSILVVTPFLREDVAQIGLGLVIPPLSMIEFTAQYELNSHRVLYFSQFIFFGKIPLGSLIIHKAHLFNRLTEDPVFRSISYAKCVRLYADHMTSYFSILLHSLEEISELYIHLDFTWVLLTLEEIVEIDFPFLPVTLKNFKCIVKGNITEDKVIATINIDSLLKIQDFGISIDAPNIKIIPNLRIDPAMKERLYKRYYIFKELNDYHELFTLKKITYEEINSRVGLTVHPSSFISTLCLF